MHNEMQCRHCVPPVSDGYSSCYQACSSPWSSKDPVYEGWFIDKDCKLMHTSGMLYVDECYRKCSNPCASAPSAYSAIQALFNEIHIVLSSMFV